MKKKKKNKNNHIRLFILHPEGGRIVSESNFFISKLLSFQNDKFPAVLIMTLRFFANSFRWTSLRTVVGQKLKEVF